MPRSLPGRGQRNRTNERTQALRNYRSKKKTATGTGTIGGGTAAAASGGGGG